MTRDARTIAASCLRSWRSYGYHARSAFSEAAITAAQEAARHLDDGRLFDATQYAEAWRLLTDRASRAGQFRWDRIAS